MIWRFHPFKKPTIGLCVRAKPDGNCPIPRLPWHLVLIFVTFM
jgi:hypothetical protein